MNQLDDWVLCRIYKKKNPTRQPEIKIEDSFSQGSTAADFTEHKFPRTCSLTHLWEFDYMSSISQLLDENAYNQETIVENRNQKHQPGQVQLLYTDPMKPQVNNHFL